MKKRKLKPARFYNCGTHGVAIVASMNYDNDGNIADWTAYIGVGSVQTENDCHMEVAEQGIKLSMTDAFHFFPNLPGTLWRR